MNRATPSELPIRDYGFGRLDVAHSSTRRIASTRVASRPRSRSQRGRQRDDEDGRAARPAILPADAERDALRVGVRGDELMLAYHDDEWGGRRTTTSTSSRCSSSRGRRAPRGRRFCASGRGYRRAFAGFDPHAVARSHTAGGRRALLADPGIVRNGLKVESTVSNAARVLEVQEELGSLDSYLWRFVDGQPIVNTWTSSSELPAETDLSKAISKDLKRRGFRFIGPTVIYAFMQTVGMVDDHTVGCFRRAS